MIDCLENKSKGASIRCLVKKTEKSEGLSQKFRELLARERRKKYNTADPFIRLHKKILKQGIKIRRQVKEFQRKGKKTMGFGASVGITTMLYFYRIGNKLEALLDDNPARWNLWSPGLGLPVLQPERVRGKPMVLVLAWRYWKSIKNRHGTSQNFKLTRWR